MELLLAPAAAKALALVLVGGSVDEPAERVDLAAKLHLGREDLGVSWIFASAIRWNASTARM